jgi:hypothetical protein
VKICVQEKVVAPQDTVEYDALAGKRIDLQGAYRPVRRTPLHSTLFYGATEKVQLL